MKRYSNSITTLLNAGLGTKDVCKVLGLESIDIQAIHALASQHELSQVIKSAWLKDIGYGLFLWIVSGVLLIAFYTLFFPFFKARFDTQVIRMPMEIVVLSLFWWFVSIFLITLLLMFRHAKTKIFAYLIIGHKISGFRHVVTYMLSETLRFELEQGFNFNESIHNLRTNEAEALVQWLSSHLSFNATDGFVIENGLTVSLFDPLLGVFMGQLTLMHTMTETLLVYKAHVLLMIEVKFRRYGLILKGISMCMCAFIVVQYYNLMYLPMTLLKG